MLNLGALTQTALQDHPLSREDALALLRVPDHDTLKVVDAAWQVRRHHFGDRVKVNVLLNAKSGLCAEDCAYCSQAKGADTEIPRYRVLHPREMLEQAKKAAEAGAQRYCIVLSGRGGTWPEVETVGEATRLIKAETKLEVCACMGLLLGEEGQKKARALREAGVDAYNHNLNTHEDHYGQICSTHTYADRLETLANAASTGMSTCSGVIIGMGETDEQIVDLALRLRERRADSIPVNFLIPIEGTELDGVQTTAHFTPWSCLRVLALFRLTNPRAELRASAGREIHLRSLQPLALMIANSIFLGNYLTEGGQEASADWAMLADLGLRAAPGTSQSEAVEAALC
ncbi:biotin synthase BioB [Deinococcus hopiensis]|uniref:Biotin synthase n=1 Tax=Deinococcus hopiensis KR-140 TaxID=695939 RepID=A0A1W1VQ95_9DEIO|nr:biotin synthase BioB [Deinococcus hopiensis]SMB95545.1 biotin synthase [Deinococcus hopiensis KR-140]